MKEKQVKDLKKEADKWYSKYIRHRDAELKNGEWVAECITCGAEKPVKLMQAGHFVSRRVSSLRFDDLNVNAQCSGCNMFKQGEQYLYSVNLDKKYGDGTAKSLMARRHETHKFTKDELLQIITDAKESVKWYEGQLAGGTTE